MNKLTDDQILALAVNAIGHETCGVFAIDRGNYYALDGAALITIGRTVIAAHEATLAPPPVMERSELCETKLARTMVVCPKCGNKHRPHATDHNLPCTGSNNPGQPGSRYTPEEKPMSLKDVRSLIADDSFAISFQSLGQYRTHLLKFIDEMIAKHPEMNNCDSTESSLSD